MTSALEEIYTEHHTKRRGEFFLVHGEERGSYLARAIGKGKRVLDIGCRDGALTRFYADGNEVTGMDIDSTALARAKDTLGITTIHTDLNDAWPIKDNFDSVVACEIIEHLYYPSTVFEKIKAVLPSGGLLVGSIPHAFSLQCRLRYLLATKKATPLQDPTHINHFSVREFKRLLSESGFIDIKIDTIIAPKFRWLSPLLPYTFAHSLLFTARKP